MSHRNVRTESAIAVLDSFKATVTRGSRREPTRQINWLGWAQLAVRVAHLAWEIFIARSAAVLRSRRSPG